MPSCVLRYCKNSTRNVNKSSGITFHRFPHTRDIRKKWIQFVRKDRCEEVWSPSEFSSICSLHFRKDDLYATKQGRRFLKNTAVPCNDAVKVWEVPVNNKTDCSTQDPLETRCHSPSGLSDIVSDDLEGALDTPLVTRLKKQVKQLKKQIKKKEELHRKEIEEKDGTIEKLENSNNRLSQKNRTLKLVLTKMKRKIMATKDRSARCDSESS